MNTEQQSVTEIIRKEIEEKGYTTDQFLELTPKNIPRDVVIYWDDKGTHVKLAGEFTEWKQVHMQRNQEGEGYGF